VHDQGTFVMPEVDGMEGSEGGRGLALMASLVDEVDVHIDPGGTTVRLSKSRAAAGLEARAQGG
jgi:anti-sigma regulatory factor (Ser/Thr protein kinase)